MSRISFISLFCAVFAVQCATSTKTPLQNSEMKITFGSCNHQNDSQDFWNSIARKKSDRWIWLGDIIYADTEDMSKMKKDYDLLKSNPTYTKFRSTHKISGIWDDHDYGANNAGVEYPKKDSSKMLLYDFLDIPHSPDDQAGAYRVEEFVQNELKVRLYLLDARSFRDSLGSLAGTILGQQQWAWLIGELSSSDADVNILASGIQFLAKEHPYEKWANFPTQRERLLQILGRLDVKNPVLISGDRHIAEMSVDTLPGNKPILEITSSGLTHSWEDFTGEENSLRVGEVLSKPNFGMLEIKKINGEVSISAELFNIKGKSFMKVSTNQLQSLIMNRKSL